MKRSKDLTNQAKEAISKTTKYPIATTLQILENCTLNWICLLLIALNFGNNRH